MTSSTKVLTRRFPASDAPANTVETGIRTGESIPSSQLDIADNRALGRFELIVDGQTAFLAYERTNDLLTLIHTEECRQNSADVALARRWSKPLWASLAVRSCASRSSAHSRAPIFAGIRPRPRPDDLAKERFISMAHVS